MLLANLADHLDSLPTLTNRYRLLLNLLITGHTKSSANVITHRSVKHLTKNNKTERERAISKSIMALDVRDQILEQNLRESYYTLP